MARGNPPNTIAKIQAKLVESPTGCLEWFGTITGSKRGGYGAVSYQGRLWVVHKLLWEAEYGPVPDRLELDHICRNRRCANLNHLRIVTTLQNAQASPLTNVSKTHCARGHAYDEINTRWYCRDNYWCRYCRKCQSINRKNFRAKQKNQFINIVDISI